MKGEDSISYVVGKAVKGEDSISVVVIMDKRDNREDSQNDVVGKTRKNMVAGANICMRQGKQGGRNQRIVRNML